MADTNERHHAYHAIYGMKEVNTLADYNYLLQNGWYDSPAKFSSGTVKKEIKKKIDELKVAQLSEDKNAVSE